MKKNPTFTFALGLIVGITLTAGTAVGAATYLKATPKTVKIVVGANQKSVESMTVNNKLYVPVRDAGDSFGYSVTGVTSSTVTFAEGATTKSVGTGSTTNNTSTNNTSTNNTKPEKEAELVDNLHDKYSTDGKLDANKVKAGIAAKEITVNAQNKEDGNSLLHYVIIEDNFAVYSAIKRNALNVNLQNNLGQTPLMLSVINENRFYYGELTNYYKADPKATDITGKQAIDYTGTNENSSLKTSLTTYMFFYKE